MTHKKYIVGFFVLIFVAIFGCKSDRLSTEKHEELIRKGKEIASATFIALSSELQKAMAEGGVPNAVKYCNLQAMPITDSLAQIYNVEIKRTSDKVRSPNNIPTAEELQVIEIYKESLVEGRQLMPQVLSQAEGNTFYAPILTNDLCLKCHGKQGDIQAYENIAKLYPFDLATGYESGQVRGIWSIKFLKQNKTNK